MNQNLNEWEQTALVHLIEECSEVQKIVTKILRFGLYSVNPLTSNLNIRDLELECMDLLACISVLEHQNIISTYGREITKVLEKRMKAIDRESTHDESDNNSILQSGENSIAAGSK